jgi:hypothetical protein
MTTTPPRWEFSALLLPFDTASRDGRLVRPPRVVVEELAHSPLPLPLMWATYEDAGALGRILDKHDPTGRASDRDVWVPSSIPVGLITRLSYVDPVDEGDEDAEQEALVAPRALYCHGHLDLVEAAATFGQEPPAPGMVEEFAELARCAHRLGDYGGLWLGATLDQLTTSGDRQEWDELEQGARLVFEDWRVAGARIVRGPQFHGTALRLRPAGLARPHHRSYRDALCAEILRKAHLAEAQARQDGLTYTAGEGVHPPRIGDSRFGRENMLALDRELFGLRTALALHDGLVVDTALPGGEVDQAVARWKLDHYPGDAVPTLGEIYAMADVDPERDRRGHVTGRFPIPPMNADTMRALGLHDGGEAR